MEISYLDFKLARSGIAAVDATLPEDKSAGIPCNEFDKIHVLVSSTDGDAFTACKIRPAYWSPEAEAFIPSASEEHTLVSGPGDAFFLDVGNAQSVFLQVTNLTLGGAASLNIEVQGVSKPLHAR